MPPKVKFTDDEITQAALDVVQESGWNAITAQSVAKKLNSSVHPLYTNNKTLDDLKRKVLKKIIEMSTANLEKHFSTISILNQALAGISFTIDYPKLVKATFDVEAGFLDLFTNVHIDSYEQVKLDDFFEGVPEPQLYKLYVQTLVYTHGLSDFIYGGYFNHYPREHILLLTREAITSFVKKFTEKSIED